MNNSILIVDDDPLTIHLMARILGGLRPLRFATCGAEALRLAHESAPDLVLLDAEMPGMSGFKVCEALKADPALAEVPVIFVTSHGEAAFEVAGFEIGAADFITKPVSPPLVLARVKAQLRVKHMADELRRSSTVDALTGVANRRCFDDALATEWRRAGRIGAPLALLMADVDHFKQYNDTYGHPAGDACLRAVAQALEGVSQRPADLVARYGGDEFVLLLPGTPGGGVERVAQRVLDAVAALAIPHVASPTARLVTVTLGLACCGPQGTADAAGESRLRPALQPRSGAAALVKAADMALYAAKRAGRAQMRLIDTADAPLPAPARDPAPALSAPP